MTISFSCPHCGTETNVDPQYAGKSGPCAACGQMISIPGTSGGVATAKSSKTPLAIAAVVIGVSMVVGLMVIGLLVALLLPAVNAARGAARRAQSINNVKQITTAIQAYEAEHGHYPPAYTVDANGKPMHSWRVLILPYLGPEADSVYQQFDLNQPWDHPTNRRLVSMIPSVYECPADTNRAQGETSYCVVSGPGFVFDGEKTKSESDVMSGDGTSQTLIVLQVSGAMLEWTEPTDIDPTKLAQGINSGLPGCPGSDHPGGAVAGFADGTVRFLSDITTPEELHDMATYQGGEVVPLP